MNEEQSTSEIQRLIAGYLLGCLSRAKVDRELPIKNVALATGAHGVFSVWVVLDDGRMCDIRIYDCVPFERVPK